MTQFGRALAELNIEIICANSSQAKGRVERAHATLGRQASKFFQNLLERPIVVPDQFSPVRQRRNQYPLELIAPKPLIGGVSDHQRDGLRLRQQAENVFDGSDLIVPHSNHSVLFGQQGCSTQFVVDFPAP